MLHALTLLFFLLLTSCIQAQTGPTNPPTRCTEPDRVPDFPCLVIEFPAGSVTQVSSGVARVELGAGTPGTDATAIHEDVAGEIAAIVDKATPVAADHLLIEDSAAANAKKDITIGSLETAFELLLDLPDLQGILPVAKIDTAMSTDAELAAHAATTTDVHGIANTAALITGNSPTITTPDMTLPNGAGSPPTTDGQLKYDRSAERLQVGTGAATSSFARVGTLTDGLTCTWDSAGNEIDCNSAGGGTADSVTVAGSPVDTTANFVNTGDITFVLTDGGIGGPDAISGTLNANTVSAAELDAPGVKAELEAVLVLANLQGTLGDAKVDDLLTIILQDGAGSPPTGDGQLKYDRSAERLQVGTGAGTSSFARVGTLTDGLVCTWDAAGAEIDCNSTGGAGAGDAVTVGGVGVDTTANFVSTGSVTFTHQDGAPGGPDGIQANIAASGVTASHMANADHGQVSWNGNVATVQGLQSGTEFPLTPTTGDMAWLTQDSASGMGTSSVGTAQSLCRWNGSAWQCIGTDVMRNTKADCSGDIANGLWCRDSDDGSLYLGDGTSAVRVQRAMTMEEARVTGNIDDTATSAATAPTWGGSTSRCRIYEDPTLGATIECFTVAGGTLLTFDEVVYDADPKRWILHNGGSRDTCWTLDDSGTLTFESLENCGTFDGNTTFSGLMTNTGGLKKSPTFGTADSYTMSQSDCGTTIANADADALTVTLLADPTGCVVCFYAETAQAITIDPNGSDSIIVSGSTLAPGDPVVLPATIGENFCVQGKDTSTWWGFRGTATGGGGGGAGTLTTIKEDGSQVGGGSTVTLDLLGADFDCTESPGTEVNCSIATGLTRDIEWNTEAALQTAWGGVNILLATEIDSSAELGAFVTDATGTGAFVRGTSPTLSTPVFILENGAGSPPLADGRMKYDRTAKRLQVGDGSGTQEFVPVGTLIDTRLCTYDSAGQEIDCNTSTLAGSVISFADTDGVWTATNVQAALEELNDDIGATPNNPTSKVHWSQLVGVPGDIADGEDATGTLSDVTGTGTTVVLQGTPSITTPIFTTSGTIFGDDAFLTYDPATAGESQWWSGPNHNGDGTDNDVYEIRQSATPGINVRMTLSPTGQVSLPGATTSGGTVELCEDADLNVNDCVGFRVPDALNLPPGSLYYDFNTNGQLPNTLIANLPPFDLADPGGTNIYPRWDDTENEIDWISAVTLQQGLSVDDLIALSGVAEGAANLGTFTGTTIADNSTVKTALQAVETAVETKATSGQTITTTKTTAADYVIGTTDSKEAYGGVIYVTATARVTAPAVQPGMSFTVITLGAIAVHVDVNASDRMYLDGVLLDDGDRASNTSTTGDMIVCTYFSADGWYCASGSNDGDLWTDGGGS